MNSNADRPRQSWQWYHLWEIVVWTTGWLHFPSCKADMPQSTLLLGLLCSLISTHVWHPSWRSLIIWKSEETELQKNTLNTSRNIVPPSQGHCAQTLGVVLNFPERKHSMQTHVCTSESHGLVSHSLETRCMPSSHICASSHSSCQKYFLWSVFVHCLPLLSLP